MRLYFSQCRDFGAGLPSGARGVQLDSQAGCPDIVPVGQCCDRCGRRVRIWVRVQGKLIGLCSWHASNSLPLNVRRQSFVHFHSFP